MSEEQQEIIIPNVNEKLGEAIWTCLPIVLLPLLFFPIYSFATYPETQYETLIAYHLRSSSFDKEIEWDLIESTDVDTEIAKALDSIRSLDLEKDSLPEILQLKRDNAYLYLIDLDFHRVKSYDMEPAPDGQMSVIAFDKKRFEKTIPLFEGALNASYYNNYLDERKKALIDAEKFSDITKNLRTNLDFYRNYSFMNLLVWPLIYLSYDDPSFDEVKKRIEKLVQFFEIYRKNLVNKVDLHSFGRGARSLGSFLKTNYPDYPELHDYFEKAAVATNVEIQRDVDEDRSFLIHYLRKRLFIPSDTALEEKMRLTEISMGVIFAVNGVVLFYIVYFSFVFTPVIRWEQRKFERKQPVVFPNLKPTFKSLLICLFTFGLSYWGYFYQDCHTIWYSSLEVCMYIDLIIISSYSFLVSVVYFVHFTAKRYNQSTNNKALFFPLVTILTIPIFYYLSLPFIIFPIFVGMAFLVVVTLRRSLAYLLDGSISRWSVVQCRMQVMYAVIVLILFQILSITVLPLIHESAAKATHAEMMDFDGPYVIPVDYEVKLFNKMFERGEKAKLYELEIEILDSKSGS